MSAPWWTRREKVAVAVGPLFWPAWYLAPRSSRRRWEDMAALMDEGGDLLDAVELLQAHGVDPLQVRHGSVAPRSRRRARVDTGASTESGSPFPDSDAQARGNRPGGATPGPRTRTRR